MRFPLTTGLLIVFLSCATTMAQAQGAPPAPSQNSAAAVANAPAATFRLKALPVRKMKNRFAGRILSRTSSIAAGLTSNALRFIGTPYAFGGTSAGGFDCSGYVQHVFAMLGIRLPRTADAQYYAGSPVRGRLTPGDLVFFQTYLPGPSHVGIYIGKGAFVHSAGRGVKVSHLSDSYYSPRYLGARRFLASR